MGAVYGKYYNEVYNDARDVASENFVGYLENNDDFNDAFDEFYEDQEIDNEEMFRSMGAYDDDDEEDW